MIGTGLGSLYYR